MVWGVRCVCAAFYFMVAVAAASIYAKNLRHNEPLQCSLGQERKERQQKTAQIKRKQRPAGGALIARKHLLALMPADAVPPNGKLN